MRPDLLQGCGRVHSDVRVHLSETRGGKTIYANAFFPRGERVVNSAGIVATFKWDISRSVKPPFSVATELS